MPEIHELANTGLDFGFPFVTWKKKERAGNEKSTVDSPKKTLET
jgi:hypothetical protein